MRIHMTLAAVLALGLTACSQATTRAPETISASGLACASATDADSQLAAVYAPGAVKRVEPIYHQPGIYEEQPHPVRAYLPSRHVEGATLYVAAPRDTNPAYLERVLTCHAAGATVAQAGNDPLRVTGVRDVDVRAVGGQLRIDVRAVDRAAGEQVLEHARGLQGSVSVTQVAAAAPSQAF